MKKLFVLMFAVGLSSCLEVVDQSILVTSVSVLPEKPNLRVGVSVDLVATVLPTNASDKAVVWSSSAPTYVSVDAATGKITALKMGAGTVTITASVGGKTAQSLVTVVPTPVAGISITGGAPASWPVGADPFVLTAVVSPNDATDKTVSWSAGAAEGIYIALAPSTDGSKVTVTPLKYSGAELITIRASSVSDPSVFREYTGTKVSFTAVDKITVAPVGTVPTPLVNGKTFSLKATILPATASNQEVTWVSSDNRIATIDNTGKVSVVGVGEVFFTATVKNESPVKSAVSDSYTVAAVPTATIKITEGDRTVAIGGKFTYHAEITPSNSTDAVVWSSSAPSVASINSTTGEVTGIGNGTATITATSGEKVATATLTVGTGPTPPAP